MNKWKLKGADQFRLLHALNLDNVYSNSTKIKKFRDFQINDFVAETTQYETLASRLKLLPYEKRQEFHHKDLPFHLMPSTDLVNSILKELTSMENNKWCYQCFKCQHVLLQCSKCKLAKYCSVECQTNNWKYHKNSCDSPNNFGLSYEDIDANLLYSMVEELVFYMRCPDINKKVMKLFKYIEIGYQKVYKNEIRFSDVTDPEKRSDFNRIGVSIHASVRLYGMSAELYHLFYRAFWSMPGIVEYLLDTKKFINNGLQQYRSKHTFYHNLNDLEEFRKWTKITEYGICPVNEWIWWIMHILCKSVTHDMFQLKELLRYEANEGISAFHDVSFVPMTNLVLSKIVALFLNVDVLESVDEAFIARAVNIIARILTHQSLRKELIKRNIMLSIIFCCQATRNVIGVNYLWKSIKMKDLNVLNKKQSDQLLIVLYNIIEHETKYLKTGNVYCQVEDLELKKNQIKYLKETFLYLISNNSTGKISRMDLLVYFSKIVSSKQRLQYCVINEIFKLSASNRRLCYIGTKYLDLLPKNTYHSMDFIFAKIEEKKEHILCRKKRNGNKCSFILCMKSKFKSYKCSQCKVTKYCSKKCQKKAWKLGHYSECSELQIGV
eukprot:415443_1